MYVYLQIYKYVYTYIYTHTNVRIYIYKYTYMHTYMYWYCSTVQGLLDWFEVDLGFTKLLFIQTHLFFMCVFVLYATRSERWGAGVEYHFQEI